MSRAESYSPTFHDKKWCDQGHVMPVSASVCPECRNTIAVVASDLLEQLNLGLLPQLDPDALIGRAHGAHELRVAVLPAMVERFRAGLIDDAELMR